jgi:uncharacterized DUF497 family protein
MRLVPNPEKEAKNLRKRGLDFSHVGELLGQSFLDEPVELENGEFALKSIWFRDATRAETRQFWRWHG